MRTLAFVGCALVLLAGCSTKPTTAPEPATPPEAAQAPPSRALLPPMPPEPPAAAPAEPSPPSVAAASGRTGTAAKTEPPPAKATSRGAAPPAQTAPRKEAVPEPAKAPAQQAAEPKEPPLDLTSLETRLKETRAIGVMTKIALKNQVDDLLNQFRGFYAGKVKTTLAELRKAYDLLVLKVLSLLQDSDPSLAAAIASSREAIWGILSDRVKFANYASN